MPPVIESIRTRLRARQVRRVGSQVLFANAFLAPAAANTSLLLAVAAFPFAVADWRALLRQSVVLAFRVHAISLIAPTVVLRFTPPIGVHIHWSGLWAWLQFALFIPVAFFMRADPTHLGRLLLLCMLGLIIGMLWRLDWAQLLDSPRAHCDASRDGYGFPTLGVRPFQRHRTAGHGSATSALVGRLARPQLVLGGLYAPTVAEISRCPGAGGLVQSCGDSGGIRVHTRAPLPRGTGLSTATPNPALRRGHISTGHLCCYPEANDLSRLLEEILIVQDIVSRKQVHNTQQLVGPVLECTALRHGDLAAAPPDRLGSRHKSRSYGS